MNDIEPTFSVLLLAKDEGANLTTLLKEVDAVMKELETLYEVLVIDGDSADETVEICRDHGAAVYQQDEPGYGAGFRRGIGLCKGTYIVTLDADYSHPPNVIRSLCDSCSNGDIGIASRFIEGGSAATSPIRYILSRFLGVLTRLILGIGVRDVSSGFRVYRREAIQDITLTARDFDVLIELLVKAMDKGAVVFEIPFQYAPRRFGASHASVAQFANSYIKTLISLAYVRDRKRA